MFHRQKYLLFSSRITSFLICVDPLYSEQHLRIATEAAAFDRTIYELKDNSRITAFR